MIIINQDKDSIINFNNIEDTYIDEDEQVKCYEILETSRRGYIFLGYYKTEDIAKEVLQEIVQAYRENQKVYEMPDEMYKTKNSFNEGDITYI